MVSAVGHISGGHFNPAVTAGFLVTRRITPKLAVVYWITPFGGRSQPRRANGCVWYVGPVVGGTIAALLYEWLYLRPLAPCRSGPAESGVLEPRPGDAAAS